MDYQLAIAYACDMKPLSNVVAARNLPVGAGACYLSGWLAFPIAIGFEKFTQGHIYRGDFAGAVVMPLVAHLPEALVAAVVGATVVWLVESDRPVIWTIFPALLYALTGFLGYHWARPPMLLDRVQQTVGAVFPAVTCVVGGILASRQRATPRSAEITPE
jgi:hypothetical protein